MNGQKRTGWRRLLEASAAMVLLGPLWVSTGVPAQAASSKGCEGGGFSLVNLTTGATVATGGAQRVDRTITAGDLGTGDRFGVRGRYISFDVSLSGFAIFEYAFTGAANPLDMTGGRRTPVFASKVPNHRGLTLTSGISAQLREENLTIARTGTGLSMTISAKDCAQGGIFQMEPERADGTSTRIVHTLAPSSTPGLAPFYFDNPRFRARVGQFLGSGCASVANGPAGQFCVRVSTRVNIANGLSGSFVARDSAQVADRVPQPECNTAAPVIPSARHCGGQSIWDVASGGRMGFVSGEDAVEVANPPTECVSNCQAQNRVRGRLVVLGFPFPVPAGSILTPRTAPFTP
jgi:hypothetical protein